MAGSYKYGKFKFYVPPIVPGIDRNGHFFDVSAFDFDQNLNLTVDQSAMDLMGPDFDLVNYWRPYWDMPILFLPEREENSRRIYSLRSVAGEFQPLDKCPLPAEKLRFPVDDPGVTKVNLVVLLQSQGTLDVDKCSIVFERMQFYATPDTKVSVVLQACLDKLTKGDSAASKVYSFYKGTTKLFKEGLIDKTYESIDVGDSAYFKILGSDFKARGFPWPDPNKTSALDREKTLKENGVTLTKSIFCMAYLPGNSLTSYPGGKQYTT